MAIRALSSHNPELLIRLYGTVFKMLCDPDETVVQAALAVAASMSKVRRLLSGLAISDRTFNKDTAIALKVRTTINNILKSKFPYVDEQSQWFSSKVLNCLNTVGFVANFTWSLALLILIVIS